MFRDLINSARVALASIALAAIGLMFIPTPAHAVVYGTPVELWADSTGALTDTLSIIGDDATAAQSNKTTDAVRVKPYININGQNVGWDGFTVTHRVIKMPYGPGYTPVAANDSVNMVARLEIGVISKRGTGTLDTTWGCIDSVHINYNAADANDMILESVVGVPNGSGVQLTQQKGAIYIQNGVWAGLGGKGPGVQDEVLIRVRYRGYDGTGAGAGPYIYPADSLYGISENKDDQWYASGTNDSSAILGVTFQGWVSGYPSRW